MKKIIIDNIEDQISRDRYEYNSGKMTILFSDDMRYPDEVLLSVCEEYTKNGWTETIYCLSKASPPKSGYIYKFTFSS